MKLYSLNKYIAFILSISIVLSVVFSCYINAYADNRGSGGNFGSNTDLSLFTKIYDGFDFSETIAKHESFYFSDSVGNKHAVARVGTSWICLFGTRATFNGSQDEQLNNYLSYYAYTGYKSISNSFGNLLSSKLGTITKGGYTLVEDTLSSNIKNVASGISYNESDDSIFFDSSSIDKLREEIKLQYYKDNGMFYVSNRRGNPTDIIKSSWYDDNTLYQEDYNMVSDYDYAIGDGRTAFYFNQSDFAYFYLYTKSESYFGSGNPYNYASLWLQFTDTNLNPITLPNITKSLNCTDSEYVDTSNYTVDFSKFAIRFYKWFPSNVRGDYTQVLLSRIISSADTGDDTSSYGTNPYIHWATNNLTEDSSYDYINSAGFWSKSNKTLVGFVSYEKLFDYIHGESSAYLGSAINKVGEDISFSIKDMNENIGSKMDTLIDTINDKKGSMSADELQNAIDKGLEDLNKTSEDIKDNTEEMNSKLDSILEALNAQNQTLLAILGVTKKIADTVDDIDEKTDYNSIISTIGTIFNAVQCALLYGQNTLKDSDSSAQAQSVSYSDDDIAVYSDSGGAYKPKVLNMDLRSGIFGHFPFSMIYHMYDWCAAFVAEAKAPVFTYNYGFLVGDKDNPELTVSIDLSQYEDWRDVAASFMRLAFTLAVAFGSYKRFKEEML